MPVHSKLISMTHSLQNPFRRSEDIVYFIISLFLVTAEAAILDDQFVKNCKSLTQYRSKFIFIFLLFFSNSSRRSSWIAQSYKFERTSFADQSD